MFGLHPHPSHSFASKQMEYGKPSGHRLRQTRICGKLGRDCSHKLSLVSLPIEARHLIYIKAGLIYNSIIHLDKLSQCDQGYGMREPDHDYQTTLNLLLTCHFVHDEVFDILYSTNRFYITFSISKTLQSVRHLVPEALKKMKNLSITMNQTSCNTWGCCRTQCTDNTRHACRFKRGCSRPSVAIKALVEWSITAPYISTHISSSQLNLDFIFDVEDLGSAQMAVRPLLGLPKLASCRVRLARDTRFKQFAEQTVASMMADTVLPSNPFPFSNLPVECQLAILKFTDLVTPHCEVEVSVDGVYRARRLFDELLCQHETMPYNELSRLTMRCDRAWSNCLCSRYHSAAPKCICWIPPTPLFLVNKHMRNLATETFFSQNRFVVMPTGWQDDQDPSKDITHFPVSIFLGRIQHHDALRYLKRLDILLPASERGYQHPIEEAFTEWQYTVERIQSQQQLPRLVITIYVCYASIVRQIAPGGEHEIMANYKRFCKPLRNLGIQQFYVHVVLNSYPWASRTYPQPQTITRQSEQVAAMTERDLERFVMGKAYSSDRAELEANGYFQLECLVLGDLWMRGFGA
jgi:hypothetical protein